MDRRNFLKKSALAATVLAATPLLAKVSFSENKKGDNPMLPDFDKWQLSEAEWKERLSTEAYYVLREEGTERSGSSPLNHEKRKGTFHCGGCDLPIYSSEHKYESGTGWPSFYDVAYPDHLATKRDWKLILPRTETHCARCGGHLGHVFDDGPEPTGKRYCMNGVALKFHPAG